MSKPQTDDERHEPPADRMSLSLSNMRLPRGRLLVIENGVEVEIVKREMDAEGKWK